MEDTKILLRIIHGINKSTSIVDPWWSHPTPERPARGEQGHNRCSFPSRNGHGWRLGKWTVSVKFFCARFYCLWMLLLHFNPFIILVDVGWFWMHFFFCSWHFFCQLPFCLQPSERTAQPRLQTLLRFRYCGHLCDELREDCSREDCSRSGSPGGRRSWIFEDERIS